MSNTVINEEDLNTKESSHSSAENIVTKTVSSEDAHVAKHADTTFSPCKYLLLIYIGISILVLVSIFSTIFALLNIKNTKIMQGVIVNGINISGLTVDEAEEKLSNEFSKKLNSNLTLIYKDYKSIIIPAQDIDATYDVSSIVQKAYSIGRNGNLIQNNYAILSSMLVNKKVFAKLEYNEQKLTQYISDISVNLPGLIKQPSHYIEDANLIILKGAPGIELLKDKCKEIIISNIENLSSSNSIDLPTQYIKPDQIDIDKIYKEIYSEPKNAYIIKEPFELNAGSSGVNFAITLDEAKNLLKESKEEYIVPLKITPPEVGIEDLGDDIFLHTLGHYTSKFNVYNYNRTTNVNIATKKINNVILLPGETFSYNKVVGERTFANGFKEASVYTSAGVINGLGGGICQVSSTLYNAVLEANLEIVERRNHRYAVSYVPLGRDATVAYGSIDFRFKNNRKYPIKVVAYTQSGKLYISIKGLEEEVEYDVEITTKRLKTIPYQTKYVEDSSLFVGTEKETQYGDNGYKYETYKTVKLNGNVVSSNLISTDNYTPLTRVVHVGTKQVPVVTPPVQTEPPATPDDNNSGNVDTENPTPDNSNGDGSSETPTPGETPVTPEVPQTPSDGNE